MAWNPQIKRIDCVTGTQPAAQSFQTVVYPEAQKVLETPTGMKHLSRRNIAIIFSGVSSSLQSPELAGL